MINFFFLFTPLFIYRWCHAWKRQLTNACRVVQKASCSCGGGGEMMAYLAN
uniref:Uncharacterized protein n=1 Tax=Vitis vinifera TaxID=29760 RepID=F6GWU3_VITVI